MTGALPGASAQTATDPAASPQAGTPGEQSATAFAPPDAARIFSYSPDGAMVVGMNEAGALCIYAVPSGEEIACADIAGQQIDFDVSGGITWSPDSTMVAFAERPFTTFIDGDLWTMNAATGDLTNVADDGFEGTIPFFEEADFDGPIYADVAPAWSPDSTRLAFSRTVITSQDDPTPNELWTVDVATGEAQRIAQVTEDEPGVLYFNMAWSPGGATIYTTFFHADLDDPENGVWAFDVATGEGALVVGADPDRFEGAAPAVMSVSPRGDYLALAYPQYLSQFSALEGGYDLFSLERGEIVPLQVPAELGRDTDTPVATLLPGFTPDGRAVLYGVRGLELGVSSLALQPLDSGDAEVIVTLPEDSYPVSSSYAAGGIVLGTNGVAFVLTGINTGVLISPADAALSEPVVVDATPVATPEEATATPESTSAATPVSAATGTVQGRFVRVYAAPTTDAPMVFTLGMGDTVDIIGEPITVDGVVWVPISDPESGTLGYVQEESLTS